MKKGKNNIKLIIGFVLGTVISSITATYAATVLSGNSVYYDNTKSGGSSSNVSGALDELYAVADDQDALKASILDLVYPVGSVYISTTDATVSDVEKRFGGTWERYSSDTTLVGYKENGEKEINSTGGSSTVTLTTSNLPSHSHNVTAKGSVSSTFTGSSATTSNAGGHTHTGSGTTSTNGNHQHGPENGANHNFATFDTSRDIQNTTLKFPNSGYYYVGYGKTSWAGNHNHTYSFTTSNNGSHTHTLTARGSVSSSFSGSSVASTSVGNGASFSVQNPYTVVYMYKRTA